jgi:hypothetical protein
MASATVFSSTRETRLVPGTGGDVLALREQPGQSDLRPRGVEFGGDGLDLVDDAEVLLEAVQIRDKVCAVVPDACK